MIKCMWCNRTCIEVPNGNEFLLKTYAYCTHCDELVPKNKSLFGGEKCFKEGKEND